MLCAVKWRSHPLPKGLEIARAAVPHERQDSGTIPVRHLEPEKGITALGKFRENYLPETIPVL
jgi:hypothetical protein